MVLTNKERARLDALYGPAEVAGPNPIKAHEFLHYPRSRQLLNIESAKELKLFLDRISTLHMSNLFPEIFHLLWLIDESGDLWFAVEEVITTDGGAIGILPKSVQARPNDFVKLGHPSLLDDPRKVARIGGEIIYDPDDPDGSGHQFCINNVSGRYGLRLWQTKEHLEAAASKFAENGLYFWLDYQKPHRQ